MGFSISWIAVHGKPKSAILEKLGLRASGGPESVPEWPISGADLAGGWYLLFLNDLVHPFTEESSMSLLSEGCLAIACQVEEHVMASAAFSFQNGSKLWEVAHESELGRRHLVEDGALPSDYVVIKDRLLKEQDLGDREEHGVDYVWDIPVTLAYEIVGYRHDAVELKSGGEPQFRELVATQ